jgi:fatty acid desaturase
MAKTHPSRGGAVLSASFPIPAATNAIVALSAVAVSLTCLWGAAHTHVWWGVALAALVFAFSNNTIFSLHHEAVHRNLFRSLSLNEIAGTLFAAFFPTIFTIQRVSHLGHHRRNRSDQELYDYYLPHQSWLLKSYWIYCLLTGFYWAIIPAAGLVYVAWPWTFRAAWFQQGPARWWGFEPFVRDIAEEPIGRVWREGVFTLAFQIALFVLLDLNFLAWLVCYWAFGINWSSVQYADHAESPRDVIEGSWNLKFLAPTQAVFLNYNLHLAHHREPGVPWIHLPKRVRREDPNPSFWKIYLRLWRGAKPAPPPPGSEHPGGQYHV